MLCLLSYFASLQDQAHIRCLQLFMSLSSSECALFKQLSLVVNEVWHLYWWWTRKPDLKWINFVPNISFLYGLVLDIFSLWLAFMVGAWLLWVACCLYGMCTYKKIQDFFDYQSCSRQIVVWYFFIS